MSYRSMLRGLLVSVVATASLSRVVWAQIATAPYAPAGNVSSQPWWASTATAPFIGPRAPAENQVSRSWVAPTAATQASGTYVGPTPPVAPLFPGSGAPFYASQLRSAYGVTSLAASGASQTVAIIDAYNYPSALSAINTYSTTMGLPQMNSGGPTFTQLNESGGTALPGVDPAGPISGGTATSNWELEEALDIEMVHAMAPRANIILYEANSSYYSDLFTAVTTAKNNSAVAVVSMSFGSSEFSGEKSYDSNFTTPASRLAASPKQGVTFIASTGDAGAPGEYPAYSPNVVAVGGTNLNLNTSDTYSSESAWSSGGGGTSTQEAKPAFQKTSVWGSVLTNSASRSIPDVSMVASNNTTVVTYDPYNGGYFDDYGTSVAAPLWAGLVADANGIRSAAGHGTLDGASQTLPALYGLSSSDFHDVTSGNNGYAAGPQYDLATGLGTPVANLAVPDLANYGTTVNSTSYSLTVSATAAKIHVATAGSYATTTLTGSIANTGSSGANSDSLTYGGFGLGASGGTLSGGALPLGAGTLAASSGASGTATFSSNTAGSFTITPTASSVANLSAGGTPALSGSAATTIAVYRLAAPNALASISLGNVHVGVTAAQALSVSNTAASDGWSEALDAGFGSVAGGLVSSGSVSLLASGGSSAAMSLAMSTAAAGAKGGSVTITFISDGNGSSGLGTTTIGSQTISVTGNVYSGQGVWNTNGGGAWTDFSKWTALGGVPGIDGVLSAGDTALFGSALSAGTAAVSLNGASPHVSSLTFNSTASYTISQGTAGILNLDAGAGTATVTVTSGSHAITSPVALDSFASFAPAAGSSLTISGAIGESGGSQGLMQAGPGLLVLSGSNSYSGGTTIANGTLQVGNGGATGTLGLGAVSDNAVLVLDRSDTGLRVANAISGSGALSQLGGGLATLAGPNTYFGPTAVSAGALVAGASNALSPHSAATISGGTLDASGYADTVASLNVGGSGCLNLGLGNTLTSSGTAAFGGTLNVAGAGTLGNYPLITYASESGSFANVTGLGANYGPRYNSNGTELDALHKAQLGTFTVTAANPAVITGGTTSLTVNAANSAPAGSDALNFTASASGAGYGLNAIGSAAAQSSGNVLGGFNSSTLAPGSYAATVTVTGSNSALGGAALNSGGTQAVAVTVWDHSNASLSPTATQTSQTISFGNVLRGAAVSSQTFTIYNLAVNTSAAYTANLQLTGVTSDPNGDPALGSNLAAFNGLQAGGSGTSFTASLNTGTYTTTGITTITLSASQLIDDSTLPGAGANNNGAVTVTLQGSVGSAMADASNSRSSFGTPLTATVPLGASYAGLASTVASTTGSGGQGMQGSSATILAGTATAAATVSMAWRTAATAPGGGNEGFVSDVVDLSGMPAVDGQTHDGSIHVSPFVLAVSYDPAGVTARTGLSEPAAAAAGLISMDYLDLGPDGLPGTVDDQWIPAVAGNFGSTNDTFEGVGAWNSSQMTLGEWGVNTIDHTVWAVLDHNSDFAVVPEPSTLVLLLGFGAMGLAGCVWRRRLTCRKWAQGAQESSEIQVPGLISFAFFELFRG